ncbi:hypothetical protein EV361DRAFT_937949 [Lentinula raphanica]|nr:hypothetical protein EV361DRAFT_937949 [Lentinula raphanica]
MKQSTTGGISHISKIPTTTYASKSNSLIHPSLLSLLTNSSLHIPHRSQLTAQPRVDTRPVPNSDETVQPHEPSGKKDRWMCYSCRVGCFLCCPRCFGTCGRKRVPRNQLNRRRVRHWILSMGLTVVVYNQFWSRHRAWEDRSCHWMRRRD